MGREGWGGAHRKIPPTTDHRGAPETTGGPGAQDKPKCPSPKKLEGRQGVLGGKMGHSSLPLLDTLILCPQPTTAPRGQQSRANQ